MQLPKLTRYARVLACLDQQVFRRFYTDRVRRVILQSLPFWIASLLVGLTAVGYEELFVWAEHISFTWLSKQPLLAFLLGRVDNYANKIKAEAK